MALLFPSCAEAARRLSEAQEHPLSWGKRLGVLIHLSLCSFCRRYGRQLRFLRRALRGYQSEIEKTSDDQLSPEARRKIQRRLVDET